MFDEDIVLRSGPQHGGVQSIQPRSDGRVFRISSEQNEGGVTTLTTHIS